MGRTMTELSPETLDKFGKFIICQWRDKLFRQHQMLQEGKLKGKAVQRIQNALLSQSEATRELVYEIVADALNTATHDLLNAIQEAHDRETGIELTVDGKSPAEISGMLHGEIQGPEGWIERFSEFKVRPL